MKKKLLSLIIMFCTLSVFASDKLTGFPANGLGKQTVTVHSFSGMANAKEGPNNLLVPIEVNSSYKWCENTHIFPWVIFELNDVYTLDRFSFLDVVPFEGGSFYNVPEYWIYVTTAADPTECGIWTEVAHYTGTGGENVKDVALNVPTDARYVKFVATRGIKADKSKDNAIRIYGFDIYGTYNRTIDRGQNVARGKEILGYNGGGYLYESPLCTLDGATLTTSKWTFGQPTLSDSIAWAVIDLGYKYDLTMFKLFQGKYGEAGVPNAAGYNVYVSETAPDMSLISNTQDLNTSWVKVVNAYASNRSADSLLIDNITTRKTRYIKIEVPRSVAPTSGSTRIFEFEAYGTPSQESGIDQTVEKTITFFPNPVKSGDSITIPVTQGSVKIFSMSGKVVIDQIITSNNTKISTKNMPAGTYTVQIIHDNVIKTGKLIVS